MQTIGNPAWSAEISPSGMALITVTYPPSPTSPTLRPVQQLRMPLADVTELAGVLNVFGAHAPG